MRAKGFKSVLAVSEMNKLLVTLVVLFLDVIPAYAGEHSGIVTHVRDGDTILVGIKPVRLSGVHAPERGENGGKEATRFMKQLVLGKRVICTLGGQKSYDRLIGICFLDGEDIGAKLIAAGFGRDCPRYSGGRYQAHEKISASKLRLPDYCKKR